MFIKISIWSSYIDQAKKRGETEMNKKTFWRIIGGIFLFIALLLGVFAKEPFINLVVNNNELALSGSFSLLFLVMGIIFLSR